jgi:excisionase family DNA binding protein
VRYRIRVSRVQDTERTINAPDESTAIDRIKSQLDQPMGILGPWRTGEVEIEILGIESRLGDLPEGVPEGPLLLSIKSAAEHLGISRSALYELIGTGEIKHLRIGRRVLISRDALREFIEANSQVGR